MLLDDQIEVKKPKKNFPYPLCVTVFSWNKSLNFHMKSLHKLEANVIANGDPKKIVQVSCEKCDKKFPV